MIAIRLQNRFVPWLFKGGALATSLCIFSAGAEDLPPWGGRVECSAEAGFTLDPAEYESCYHFLVNEAEAGAWEKLYMHAIVLPSDKIQAAILDDAPGQPGQVVIYMNSDRDQSQLLVARGRWPTDADYDCKVGSEGFCVHDRADSGGGEGALHVLVRGDSSRTTTAAYWQNLQPTVRGYPEPAEARARQRSPGR